MHVRYFYDDFKNAELLNKRGVSFEDVINAINEDKLLEIVPHHNTDKYPDQQIFIVVINDYVYAVPFVEKKHLKVLKTIYPSRKLTKIYLRGKMSHKKNPYKLDAYEQDIEDNINLSKALKGKEKTKEIAKLKAAAKEHIRRRNKEKRISIRVFASDLERLKQIAEEEGLPYQTLVTSIIHKFTTGRLVSKEKK